MSHRSQPVDHDSEPLYLAFSDLPHSYSFSPARAPSLRRRQTQWPSLFVSSVMHLFSMYLPCHIQAQAEVSHHVENLLLNLSFTSRLFCDPPDPSRLRTLKMTSGTGSSLSLPLSRGSGSGSGGKGFRSFLVSLRHPRRFSMVNNSSGWGKGWLTGDNPRS